MTRTRSTRLVAAAMAFGLVAAACGSDDDTGDDTVATDAPADDDTATTDAPADDDTATTEAPADDDMADDEMASGTDLSEVCPSPMVIQTDWFPESEYGAVYNLIGEPYSVDTQNQIISGPMWSEGEETGIEIEVRAGGPAIGFSPPRQQMYTEDDIHLAFSSLDAQAIAWSDAPLVSVIAPLEKNPQIIMWDPEVYPDVETVEDLGEEGVIINVFAGGGFAEVFTAQGIWSEDQVDPSYDGSPARFIAEGDIAQQGFATSEPYLYENQFEEYGRRPAFQLLHDAGYIAYTQTLAARPDDLETLSPCLEQFVPMVQRSAIEFLDSPDRANAMIVDAVEQIDDFWVYDMGVAQYAVDTMLELEIMGNGSNDTLGDIDLERVESAIADIRDGGANVTVDDVSEMFTNEFIDPSIGR